jgi:hypothetical protein
VPLAKFGPAPGLYDEREDCTDPGQDRAATAIKGIFQGESPKYHFR